MRTSLRYGLAVLAGVAAGGGTYVAARPPVGPPYATLAAGANLLVWTLAGGLLLDAYARLDERLPVEGRDTVAAAKLGGLAGGISSLAVGGPVLVLAGLVPFRYAAVVGVFVFGAVLASMAVGMKSVVVRTRIGGEGDESRTGPGA